MGFLGNFSGRTLLISLDRGDLFIESIEREAAEAGFRNAVIVSAIATFEKLVMHRVLTLDEKAVESYETYETPLELSSVDGMIIDGHIHLHFTASDPDNVYIGHLEPGTKVMYLAEILLAEIDGMGVKRIKNELGINKVRKV